MWLIENNISTELRLTVTTFDAVGQQDVVGTVLLPAKEKGREDGKGVI